MIEAWSEGYEQSDVYTLARMVHEDGMPVLRADLERIDLFVFDRNGEDPGTTIHEELELEIAAVQTDGYVLDGLWSNSGAPDTIGYNFKHVLESEYGVTEGLGGHVLRIEYRFQRTGGRGPLWLVHNRTVAPVSSS